MILQVISATNFISHKLETEMNEVRTESLYVKVVDLEQAVTFFRDFLELEAENEPFSGTSCKVVKLNDETFLHLSDQPHPEQTDEIYLHTKDCIEQYCRLKAKGIIFNQAPTYMPQGLMAEFTDGYGNRYFLLEPRKYSE